MSNKKSINLGFRGWMLVIYQATAFLLFTAFTNWPMNILADMYGGAGSISTIYTVCGTIAIVIQLIMSRFIGKVKNIKALSVIFGAITLVLALGIMLIPPQQQMLWKVCYGLINIFSVMYCTFSLGILVGQWFPRRKGTVMGIATFAFPIANGLIGAFAGMVFSKGYPNVFGAFLPFFIICAIGFLVGVIFIKDYPEQCGAYRDNDKSMTPEMAKAMMEAEIKAKATTVWKTGKTLSSRDFWFITIPAGFLLMCAVGMMTQTQSILTAYGLPFEAVMGGVMIVACIGSWLLGVLDTRFGTKKAIIISVIVMIVAGIAGMIKSPVTLVIAVFCLAIFMGAASNFTVSAAAQYWRREDFPSVFACVSPIASFLQSLGPMIVANILFSRGPENLAANVPVIFGIVAGFGVISIICILLFKPAHVKSVDDKLRAAAGLELDDALAGRK